MKTNTDIKLIGIHSPAKGGKDTVAKIIQDLSENTWQNKKFADKLYELLSELMGIDVDILKTRRCKDEFDASHGINNYSVREYLQALGEGIRKIVDKDAWVNALFKDYKRINLNKVKTGWDHSTGYYSIPTFTFNYPRWIISDVRYPNEIEAIKSRGGIVIKKESETEERMLHISEIALIDYNDWDYILPYRENQQDLVDDIKEMMELFRIK